LLSLVLLSALHLASSFAQADPYTPPAGVATEPSLEALADCPSGPAEPYEGEDAAAGETRLLRSELVEVCEALAIRSDEAAHRLWWLVAEALEAHDQRALTNTLLTELRDELEPPVGVHIASVAGGALPIEDAASQEYSDNLVSAVNASGEAAKGGLWFLAGCLVACLVSYVIYRQVMPRA
jgi:hypothetical protein